MATIPRDVGHPVDLNNPVNLAEYEGFAADVPTTASMIEAVNDPPATPNASSVRAARMLRPAFLQGLPAVEPNVPPPDATPAQFAFERQGLHGMTIAVPSSAGGLWADVEVWSFEDAAASDGDGDTWPGPLIRVRQNRVAHTNLRSRTGPHTIHHHGIEPTPMNDGVGHLTFEVASGRYTYQWATAEAGTYFYHCHRNTVLHFERGMYGALIIDPDVDGAPFTTFGPGRTYVANNLVDYAAEALWVFDDVDTRWHGLRGPNYGPGRNPIDHVASGIQGLGPGKLGDANNAFMRINDPDNPRLHDFDPNVFVVTGVPVPVNPTPRAVVPGQRAIPRSIDNHQLVDMGATVQRGGKLLVRTLNAAYLHTRWVFPSQIPGLVIAADGRTFGLAPWGDRYSSPVPLASIGHQFQLSVARRWDVLLDTSGVAPGVYDVAVSAYTSVGDDRLVTVRLPITVL